MIVFEVAFVADYSIDGGSIDIDFATGARSVICPALNIELLTPPGPSVTAGSSTSDSARSVQ